VWYAGLPGMSLYVGDRVVCRFTWYLSLYVGDRVVWRFTWYLSLYVGDIYQRPY